MSLTCSMMTRSIALCLEHQRRDGGREFCNAFGASDSIGLGWITHCTLGMWRMKKWRPTSKLQEWNWSNSFNLDKTWNLTVLSYFNTYVESSELSNAILSTKHAPWGVGFRVTFEVWIERLSATNTEEVHYSSHGKIGSEFWLSYVSPDCKSESFSMNPKF